MNGSLKAKAIAGVGVAAILSGALLAFAPTFAGAASVDPTLNPGGETNPNCVDVLGPGAIEAKFDSAGNSGESGTASGGGLIVDWTFNDDDTIDFVVDEFSDYAVSAAIVKQGNDANVYVYDPAVVSDTGLVDPRDDGVFSHITFCADGTPNTTTTTEDVQDTTTTTEDVQDTTTTTEDVQDTTTTTEDVLSTTSTTAGTTTTSEDVLGSTSTVAETTTTDGDGQRAASTTTEGPEVLDNTVGGSSLPRTGSGSDRLAAVGAALMIFGAILVGGSRRSILSEG